MTTTALELETAFTQAYREHLNDHPAIREAHCLRVLMPRLFEPYRADDSFAGRISYRKVGFGLESASGGPGYYCDLRPDTPEAADLCQFWKAEATIKGKLQALLSPELKARTENSIASMDGRLAGSLIDFEKLVRIGIPGLRAEVESMDAPELREGMLMALDVLAGVIRDYARQAATLGRNDVAEVLADVAGRQPETFRQAAQLAWLYALISGVVNYGRMDVYLGDALAKDLDEGRLTEDEALALLQNLWQMMADRKIVFNGRVFIGGRGRPNEANADRFAMLAMEATRTVIEIEPQLTLRFYEGMNPALMQKALDVIGEGRTYPMLFNDDVNVPAVTNGFRVPREAAEQYLPYGCGEYALDHLSFGSPNCSLNLLKALETTLHRGVDPLTGRQVGLDLGPIEAFESFDDLWRAYQRQVEHFVEALADRHRLEYRAEAESAAFLFTSMLFDDCIARGRSVVDGGIRYRGGLIETFAIVNTADSLAAIKKVVYEDRSATLADVVSALDRNFEGSSRIERLLKNAPKYGNDDDRVDGLVQAVSDHVARHTYEQADRIGFHYFLVVNINNHMNVGIGKITSASADGRRCGEPLANGNTPTAGNDTSGVTAFLNSIAKPDPSFHAGYTHNMKFSRRMFREERPKLEALLGTYFECGGTQAMITVLDRGDLEAALKDPEKHRNLIVRVGGFSARFVELPPEVQADLIHRTLY
ncbi:MAG TPA: pyruvate formate lyase family protein [Fimbriimonas sp.]